MGYQEILIRSSKISLEKMSEVIQKKMDPMFVDSANKVAMLRNDFKSSKTIMFGQEIATKQLDFNAGDRFLVVCGERSVLQNIKRMFPYMLRNSIEIYPMESVMQSPQYFNKADYKDVFEDSEVPKSVGKRDRPSIRQKLSENQKNISKETLDKLNIKVKEKDIKSHEER